MIDHSIFIEAHHVDDNSDEIGIAALCTCGAWLTSAEGQLLLDDVVDAAWNHRDSDLCKDCNE